MTQHEKQEVARAHKLSAPAGLDQDPAEKSGLGSAQTWRVARLPGVQAAPHRKAAPLTTRAPGPQVPFFVCLTCFTTENTAFS